VKPIEWSGKENWYSLALPSIEIWVTRFDSSSICPWEVSTSPEILWVEQQLESDDLEDAKVEALEVVKSLLEKCLQEVNEVIK